MVAISGSIVNTLGETFTGVVTISRIKSGDSPGIGDLVARVVIDDGTLATEPTENEGALDGTLYSVYFDADSGPSWTEHWLVGSTEAVSVTPASLVVHSTRTSPAHIPGSLAVDGNATVGGDLDVTGDIGVGGGLAVTGATSVTLDMTVGDDIVGAADSAVYLGAKATDGSWRMVRSGNNVVFQRRESGSYVTKSTVLAA